MKKVFFLLCFSLVGALSFAQNKVSKTDLLGTWKPVSVDLGNGAMKYDFVTQAMYLSDSVRQEFKATEDSAMAIGFMNTMFTSIGKMTMSFKEADVYIEKSPSGKLKEGTYTFDAASSVLTIKTNQTQTLVVTKSNDQLCFEGTMGNGRQMLLCMKKE